MNICHTYCYHSCSCNSNIQKLQCIHCFTVLTTTCLPACLFPLQELGHSSSTNPEGPLMLVLAPTRELALQVAGQCRDVRKHTGLRTVCVYGGVPKESQVCSCLLCYLIHRIKVILCRLVVLDNHLLCSPCINHCAESPP